MVHGEHSIECSNYYEGCCILFVSLKKVYFQMCFCYFNNQQSLAWSIFRNKCEIEQIILLEGLWPDCKDQVVLCKCWKEMQWLIDKSTTKSSTWYVIV